MVAKKKKNIDDGSQTYSNKRNCDEIYKIVPLSRKNFFELINAFDRGRHCEHFTKKKNIPD